MKILKLICLLILSLNISAKAVIRNVPSQYSNIQAAINACSNSDTILVQPGTYFENVIFRGKKIVLTSKFYQNFDYSFIQSTIINGSTPVHPDSGSCVIICNHEDSTTVLQGFTLTGGTGTKWQDEQGAGLFREGGGLLTALSSPIIQYNIITGNNCLQGGVVSTGGGGIRSGDAFPRIYNNVITNNSARYGAGVVLNYTGCEFKNNLVFKNFGSQDYGAGSGIWINGFYTRTKYLHNNTIAFNSAIAGTGGVQGAGIAGDFRNNIVWKNTSPNGAQINASGLTVRYCDVSVNTTGGGNVNIDPQFDSVNYYLKSTSPCIDIGDSSTIYNDRSDPNNPALAQWPARGTLRNDMGAYGGPLSHVIANTVVGVIPHSQNISPDNFHLSQNYPNPFNPSTTIEYFIPQSSAVTINIYNSLGQKIEMLLDKFQSAGNYKITWNGQNLGSGIYFYEMVASNSAGRFIEKKKMLLVK